MERRIYLICPTMLAMSFVAACSGSSSNPNGPTIPTISTSPSQTNNPAPTGPSVPPTPGTPSANSPVPVYKVTGGLIGCVTGDLAVAEIVWTLNMNDAGAGSLRFTGMAQHDDTPGCDATVSNPRQHVVTGGVVNYTPHSSGQTTFSYDPKEFDCGRAQIDVSMIDTSGKETLLFALVINYGKQCLPTSPPPSCTADTPTAKAGNSIGFTGFGGDGNFQWSTPGGIPQTDTGKRFVTAYKEVGEKTVTVTSGDKSATCGVVIEKPTTPVVCSPDVQTVAVGKPASMKANGGTGQYFWSATGGIPDSGSGGAFSTTYKRSGTYQVSVRSGDQKDSCEVRAKNICKHPEHHCPGPEQCQKDECKKSHCHDDD